MKIKDNQSLSRAIIQEHYDAPNYKKNLTISMYKENEKYDSCIDDVTIGLEIKDDVVTDIGFIGEACAISTASTDIVLEMINGKNIKEVEKILNEFIKLTTGMEYDEEMMGELNSLSNVNKHPIRVKCAQINIKPISRIISRYIKERE